METIEDNTTANQELEQLEIEERLRWLLLGYELGKKVRKDDRLDR